MKKFTLIIFLLFTNFFPNAFAEPKAMLKSINNTMPAKPYVAPNYDDTKKYHSYYIDDIRTNAYNRYTHSEASFFGADKHRQNFFNLTHTEKFKNLS